MVSATVAPCFCLPVSRLVKLRTASRGSVPASSLFSACSTPVLLKMVWKPVIGAYSGPYG